MVMDHDGKNHTDGHQRNEENHHNDERPQHDFDQRHDGPFDQPSRPVDLAVNTHNSAPTLPSSALKASSPITPTGQKKHVHIPWTNSFPTTRRSMDPGGRKRADPPSGQRKSMDAGGRKSMDYARRTSRDFDVRRDGPYGRPSLAMTRRRSSGMIAVGTDVSSREQERQRQQSLGANTDVERVAEGGSEDSQGSEAIGFEPEPPRLNYDLRSRRWAIVFFWAMVLIDCIVAPVALYFTLWYMTDLSPNLVFTIVTAALGGVSIFEYFIRAWRLWRKNSTCRVIGAHRWYFDWFHFNFTIGWIAVMIELIVGTVQENPPIRLLAMPLASMLFVFGTELLVVDLLRYYEVPSPCRMSSIPKGAQLRPAIYTMIEDVIAVDGSGGTAYREALNKRYEASHVFRAMLRRLGVFWAFGAEGCAVVTTVLVFTIQHEAAFVVGWSFPFAWGGVWALITIVYVKRKLAEESRVWEEEILEKSGGLRVVEP